MNALTIEWIEKAEGDFGTARREAGVTQDPNPDAVCFHAQQCVEKYLKAALQEAGVPVPRTHNLRALLALVVPVAAAFQTFDSDFAFLTAFAVGFRYPGYRALEADGARALDVATRFRFAARQHFSLP